jgi:restriction endonuclease
MKMPRRTNSFQNLFLRLQKAMASCGAKVEESAEVFNHVAGRKEEIDVLVTFTHSGYSYRVGIQCRDHSRNAGADWIRDLKLQKDHCHLDKMIAVHSKGFSPAAQKTASYEGIEVRTLKDAQSSDWTRLHPQTFQLQIPLHLVAMELSPVIKPSKVGLDPMRDGCLVCKCHKRRSESPNQLAQRAWCQ